MHVLFIAPETGPYNLKFVDALGGVNMTFETCIRSRFEGRTHRFRKGENHLDGEEALDIVRIRKNECAPEESDLTRARRQQQFLEAVKGKLFNPLTSSSATCGRRREKCNADEKNRDGKHENANNNVHLYSFPISSMRR